MTRSQRVERIRQLKERTQQRKKDKGISSEIGLAHKGAHKSPNTRFSIPCINEGAILEYCYKCNGDIKHVRECEIYEKCTRAVVSTKVHACINCKDYVADNGI